MNAARHQRKSFGGGWRSWGSELRRRWPSLQEWDYWFELLCMGFFALLALAGVAGFVGYVTGVVR